MEGVGLGARGMVVLGVWGGGRVAGRRVVAGVGGCWGKVGLGGWRAVRCTSGLLGQARVVLRMGKGREKEKAGEM